MDWAKLFYVAGALAFGLLWVLHALIARTVLPARLLSDIQKRTWRWPELAVTIVPGLLACVLGLVFLRLTFWFVFCGLSLAMLGSALGARALERFWPRLSLFRKAAWIFAVYLAIALVIAALSLQGSNIRWTHARGILALVLGLLFLALAAATVLLVVGGATVYLAVASAMVRAILLPSPTPPGDSVPELILDEPASSSSAAGSEHSMPPGDSLP
ncbi:MAG TPA: hypothetical protein VE825_10720 [Terriglobales bacterium]|jgi:MFS family permease|nr:hypothetical protein [Terriglobales bacterium]